MLGNTHTLAAAAALVQDEQKSCKQQHLSAAASGSMHAAASCRNSKPQQAPTGRSAVHPALLDSRCASNAAATRRPLSFSARERVVAAKIGNLAARVHALAAAAAAAAAAHYMQ